MTEKSMCISGYRVVFDEKAHEVLMTTLLEMS